MKNIEMLTREAEELTAKLETANSTIAEADKEITGYKSRIEEMETELKSSQETITTITAEKDGLNDKLTSSEKTVSELTAKNTDLAAKEQDIQRRATALLAKSQAELGNSPPLGTGAGSQGGKPEAESKALTGIERTIAALESKNKNI